MKEGLFYTDSGPTCPVNDCARPGYGCWRYHVRQHDNEKIIAVKATCYICQTTTYFQARVDAGDLNSLTAADVRQAHQLRAQPMPKTQWETW